MRQLLLKLTLTLFGVCLVNAANAETEFDLRGFGTLGLSQIDNSVETGGYNSYQEFNERLDDRQDSKFALQGSAVFNERFDITAQLIARGREEYSVDTEWAYFSYRLLDGLKLRAGKLRRPLFYYSDFAELGIAYPWVRAPIDTYTGVAVAYAAVNAIDLFWETQWADWLVTSEAYIGESDGEMNLAGEHSQYKTRQDRGLVLSLQRDWLEMRLAYNATPDASVWMSEAQQQQMDALRNMGLEHVADHVEVRNARAEVYSFAVVVDYDNWLFTSEYMHFDPERLASLYGGYAMLGRRLGPFTIHYTYSQSRTKFDHDLLGPVTEVKEQALALGPQFAVAAEGLTQLEQSLQNEIDTIESFLRSHTIGVRYDVNDNVALKFEYQKMTDVDDDDDANLFSVAVDFAF